MSKENKTKVRKSDHERKKENIKTRQKQKSRIKTKKVDKVNIERSKKKGKKQRKSPHLSKSYLENLIIELYKKGHSPEKIGLILRDTYGVSNVREILGKKMIKFLKERQLDVFPPDLNALIEKMKKVKKHFEKNKKDYVAKRSLQILEARIRILTNYYKKKGVLNKNFTIKI